jgi:hypothetical protein
MATFFFTLAVAPAPVSAVPSIICREGAGAALG